MLLDHLFVLRHSEAGRRYYPSNVNFFMVVVNWPRANCFRKRYKLHAVCILNELGVNWECVLLGGDGLSGRCGTEGWPVSPSVADWPLSLSISFISSSSHFFFHSLFINLVTSTVTRKRPIMPPNVAPTIKNLLPESGEVESVEVGTFPTVDS